MERTNIGMLLAKIESTYGVDPVPTGGLNLIAVARGAVTFGANFTHLTRTILDGTTGRVAGANVMPEVALSFTVELRGNRTTGATDSDLSSGLAANAIEIDPLLQACDLAATYEAETTNGARDGMVIYKPFDPVDHGPGVTFYWYSGGKLHKIHGAKGNPKGVLEAGQFGKVDFEFKGLYGDICDAALPSASNWLRAAAVSAGGTGYAVNEILTVAGGTATTAATLRVTRVSDVGAITGVKILQVGVYSVSPTTTANAVTGGSGTLAALNLTMATNTAGAFLDTKPPLFVASASTVGEFSPVFTKLEFDLGNQISRREDANSANGVRGFFITGREPKCTIDPESVAETTHPIWNDLEQATARTITGRIGTQTGNRFQLTFAGISQAVGYGDRNGNRTQPITYAGERALLSDVTGDEFQLIFY